MKEISATEFEHFLNSGEYLLVDFWAPWCGPCNTIGPVLEEIEAKYKQTITFAKMNIDRNDEIATKYNVVSIPNLCVFRDGQLVERTVGFKSKKDLTKFLDKLLKNN
ncbi:MAG: thioredoxin [Clostridia bacterium]|nr:thioredoxin [Clostridia bacterium]